MRFDPKAILSFLHVLAAILLASEAGAESHVKYNFCKTYAKNAMWAAHQAQRFNCGFTGGRWELDQEGHFNWCMAADTRRATEEEHLREFKLEQCRQRNAFCEYEYVPKAMWAAHQNESRNCGFTGGRWSLNKTGHKDWCLRVERGRALSEMQKRDAMLRQCR